MQLDFTNYKYNLLYLHKLKQIKTKYFLKNNKRLQKVIYTLKNLYVGLKRHNNFYGVV